MVGAGLFSYGGAPGPFFGPSKENPRVICGICKSPVEYDRARHYALEPGGAFAIRHRCPEAATARIVECVCGFVVTETPMGRLHFRTGEPHGEHPPKDASPERWRKWIAAEARAGAVKLAQSAPNAQGSPAEASAASDTAEEVDPPDKEVTASDGLPPPRRARERAEYRGGIL